MIRLHIPYDLAAGAGIVLSVEHSHYLANVMRQVVGNTVAVFNGRDGEWLATITEIRKKAVLLALTEQLRPQPPAPQVHLILALIKRARLEWAIEKATELGAGSIQLVTTQHTQADHIKLLRLQAIATESAEQTGRCDVPTVQAPQSLDKVLTNWTGGELMFCDEALAGKNETSSLAAIQGCVSILIGPEGGFSIAERERLCALPYVSTLSLGPNILRADTAVVSALTLVQAALRQG